MNEAGQAGIIVFVSTMIGVIFAAMFQYLYDNQIVIHTYITARLTLLSLQSGIVCFFMMMGVLLWAKRYG